MMQEKVCIRSSKIFSNVFISLLHTMSYDIALHVLEFGHGFSHIRTQINRHLIGT